MNKMLCACVFIGCLLGACNGGNSGTGVLETDSIPPREATDPVPEPPQGTDSLTTGNRNTHSANSTQPQSAGSTAAGQTKKLYRIAGNEPFWSLTIGKPYSIYRSMAGDSITFAYEAPKSAAGRPAEWAQLYPLGQQNWVLLRRGNTPCSDGMSDRQWEYTATLLLRGQLLDGCGEKLTE